MSYEVEVVVFFPEGEEPPNEGELEAAIRQRYPDATVTSYDEEEC